MAFARLLADGIPGGYLGSIFTGQRGIRRMDMCGGGAKVQGAGSISVGREQDSSIERKK
jgi:hypothetical protein